MYELQAYQTKQNKLSHLSTLICKVAIVPEDYLSGEEVRAVVEYLCDIEYELLRQLEAAAPTPPEKKGNLALFKCR
jgi:hypothetical protein